MDEETTAVREKVQAALVAAGIDVVKWDEDEDWIVVFGPVERTRIRRHGGADLMPRPRLYTEESVERSLEVHCPGRWTRQAVGYVVDHPGVGELHLRTLKEAYAFVCGAAFVTIHQREASTP